MYKYAGKYIKFINAVRRYLTHFLTRMNMDILLIYIIQYNT